MRIDTRSERAYARGFHQATEAATDIVEAGGGLVELTAWAEAVRDWREGRSDSYTPPSPGEFIRSTPDTSEEPQ